MPVDVVSHAEDLFHRLEIISRSFIFIPLSFFIVNARQMRWQIRDLVRAINRKKFSVHFFSKTQWLIIVWRRPIHVGLKCLKDCMPQQISLLARISSQLSCFSLRWRAIAIEFIWLFFVVRCVFYSSIFITFLSLELYEKNHANFMPLLAISYRVSPIS